ncbi:MAG: thiolase family protein [Chloroflexota bacterium]|nr:thiolase family protein [Chloroflexota bacterium]
MRELKEAVVVDAVRTPIAKSAWKGKGEKKGDFCDVSSHFLIDAVITALVDRIKQKNPDFNTAEIEDCAVGCHATIGEQSMIGRMAVLISDLPDEVSGWTATRYGCGGLQAIISQAQAIMSGCGDVMIAAGVENMSRYPLMAPLESALKSGYPMKPHPNFEKRGGFVMMGTAAEMISDKYGVYREEMDRFSLRSHQKAVKSMRESDWYEKRVMPIHISPNGHAGKTVSRDENPREIALDEPDAAWEKMAVLEPRFKDGGEVTAASSAGLADGAAAVMLMSKEKAEKLGLKPMATIRSMAVAGSDPFYHLLAPIPAARKALERAGITIGDAEVIEIIETFAAPVLAFCKEFDLDYDDPRINPTGGAIALGNPIGSAGVLYFIEMVHWMERNNLRWGLQCLSGVHGVGAATVVEREA